MSRRSAKPLGEKKNHPKYIETVPGYGYRFVGEVKDADEELVIETHTISRLTIEEDDDGAESSLRLPAAVPSNYKWLAVAVVAVLGTVIGIWLWSKGTLTLGRRSGPTGYSPLDRGAPLSVRKRRDP